MMKKPFTFTTTLESPVLPLDALSMPICIIQALYGLKSSALAWRNHLSDVLSNSLGFESSLADPDAWYKPSITSTGHEYYSYILYMLMIS
jgi:hypothetical protein